MHMSLVPYHADLVLRMAIPRCTLFSEYIYIYMAADRTYGAALEVIGIEFPCLPISQESVGIGTEERGGHISLVCCSH